MRKTTCIKHRSEYDQVLAPYDVIIALVPQDHLDPVAADTTDLEDIVGVVIGDAFGDDLA